MLDFSMNKLLFFSVLCISFPAIADDFLTPQGALKSLENAYKNENIEAAVAAKNFDYEARKLLENLKVDVIDNALIKNASETLELAFREHIKKAGFPNFKELKCTIFNTKQLASDLVELSEKCTFQNGNSVEDIVHVAKSNGKWGVVILQRTSD